mmetsp:Transcript_45056/g.68951  ORF Transcript_45056/g.68951 Transcript_45056/m.68951 type:complete len:141 (+) Transcript_45056:529-951(+)
MEEFGAEVDFLMVYIREAHASDQWPLGNIVSIEQHKDLQSRIAAAKNLEENFDFKMKIVVDNMDNQFNKQFLAWPERYYFFRGHHFSKISLPANEFGFDRLELRKNLYIGTATCEEGEELPPLPAAKYPVFSDVPIDTGK